MEASLIPSGNAAARRWALTVWLRSTEDGGPGPDPNVERLHFGADAVATLEVAAAAGDLDAAHALGEQLFHGRGGVAKDDRAAARWYFRRADIPQRSRGDAAAVAWIFRGDESRRRRGRDADIPWRPARASGTISPPNGATRAPAITSASCTRRERASRAA